MKSLKRCCAAAGNILMAIGVAPILPVIGLMWVFYLLFNDGNEAGALKQVSRVEPSLLGGLPVAG